MTSPALLTQSDGCYWMEGRPMANWTVRNNRIVGVNSWGPDFDVRVNAEVAVFRDGVPTADCVSVSTPGVFANITVSGNTFVSLVSPPAYGSATAYAAIGVMFTGNRIYQSLPQGASDFATVASDLVVIANNSCFDLDGTSRA